MQDKDFDSLLKRKFEYQDLPEHEDGKWASLTDRLDAFDRRRNVLSKLVYALALSILLLGNVAWFFNWQGLYSTNTSRPLEPIVKRDTLLQTIHIVRYDTIYRTIITENKFTNPAQLLKPENIRLPNLPTNSQSYEIPASTSTVPQISGNDNEATSLGGIKDAEINYSTRTGSSDTPVPIIQPGNFKGLKNIFLPLNPLKARTIPFARHSITQSIPLPNILMSNEILQEKTQSNLEEQVQKKSPFRWHPMWINSRQLLFFPGKLEGYVVSSGLQMERNISDRIALGASLRLGFASVESSDISRSPSLDNTAPTLPGPTYRFNHWDVDFMPLAQYQLYGHFRFASLGKTRLMAGSGALWISTSPYIIDYQYLNQDFFSEKELEFKKTAETRWQGLHLLLQAETPLSNKIAIGTRVSGLIPKRPLQTVLDQSLGLDFWLRFRL